MADLKLGPLPRQSTVRLTIVLMEPLKEELDHLRDTAAGLPGHSSPRGGPWALTDHVGVACGPPSQICVVDIDKKLEALEWWNACKQHLLPTHAYLRDETGGLRFWPIKIGTIDIDALQRDRDQLFAEAYALFQAGVQWWPDHGFERQHVMPQQSDRYEADPWEEPIRSYLNTLLEPQTTVTEIARAIGIDAPKVGRARAERITATMQDLGWKRGKHNGPKGTRWWVRA